MRRAHAHGPNLWICGGDARYATVDARFRGQQKLVGRRFERCGTGL